MKFNSDRYTHRATDPWRWRPAGQADLQELVDFVIEAIEVDATAISEIDSLELSRNISHAIVNQMFNPKTEMVSVAVITATNRIIAFNWATRGVRPVWSGEEMITPRMLNVDQSLSSRTRVALCVQAMRVWERWAHLCDIKIINSNSMRYDWQPLIRLHKQMGYDVRGSEAFKRLNTIRLDPENTRIILP
jgi:hypothetical protein